MICFEIPFFVQHSWA